MRNFANASAAIAALLIPSGMALAGSRVDRNIVVPDTSIDRPEDHGLRAHTHHLIYIGPPLIRSDVPEVPVAMSGPALLAAFAGPSGYHPSDIRAAYGIPSTGGSGAIAIVDAYHYASSLNDFNVFATQFGLAKETSTSATSSSNQVFQVVFQGTKQPRANAGWGQEAALDIEWAHSMAPGAKIYLVEANSASLTDMFATARKAATLPGVQQVSMSFGASEFSSEASYDYSFTQSGVTFYASSGDTGGVKSYPAISPNVVGVGGTSLHVDVNGVVTGETAWNGSGGGLSTYEARPSYQDSLATLLGTKRGMPDVSLVADPYTGCSVYDSTPYQGYSGWMVFGGTSLASPCVAGIANISGHNLASSQAELSRIYAGLGGGNFRDITSGTAGSFSATSGWDYITGVGSPVGLNGL
ncbi:S53 family peptidase [Fimbriimonas ginsengisoli]|uniref:Putative family S53 non-peptidase n=1 Tax=Fimbriimonas ginsengisoli Gsoil 348 TaxID=661478 RepID=A0A068NWY4_FIMGI|nr:S53 family peptidase [Fimbriimonas ginsengisoli]AIE86104.1 putative family S53 non-peptidase [Fimbriimonas ginsengisoli Gsoil 348]